MEELQFQVIVDRDLNSKVEGVVAFGEFTSDDPRTAIYPVKGLQQFYVDLILGRPFPLVFVTRDMSLGTLVAIALFMHRDLALHPNTQGFVSAVALVDQFGVSGFAHVDRDLSKFLKLLGGILGGARGKKAQQEVLTQALGWVRGHILEGSYPGLPAEKEPPKVLDYGNDGFVVATSPHGDLVLGWEELFRMGYLRGILYYRSGEDRWQVLGAKKSPFLALDLVRAADVLNEAEAVMGEPRGWASDGFWLSGPEGGTMLIQSMILQVLLRV